MGENLGQISLNSTYLWFFRVKLSKTEKSSGGWAFDGRGPVCVQRIENVSSSDSMVEKYTLLSDVWFEVKVFDKPFLYKYTV